MLRQLMLLAASIAALVWAAKPPSNLGRRGMDEPLLPRPEFLKTVGASQLPLVVDYYWIQMAQQMGGALTEREYRDIYFYAKLVTELDPKMWIAYYYGAAATPYNRGRENWVNTKESSELIETGLKVFPESYRLRFLRAYNLMFFDKNYAEAAKEVDSLAKHPEAPAYLPQLATRLYAAAGRFEDGMALAVAMRDAAETDEERAFFDRRIKELQLEPILQAVDQACDNFTAKEGRRPKDMDELVAKGYLPMKPVDPLGGEIVIFNDKRARSTQEQYRLEVITDQTKNL